MKPFLLANLAVAGLVTTAAAQTRAVPPAETIRMRQGNYKQMGAAMKGINDQLRAESPALPAIRAHAALLTRHALQVLHWFPRGTGAESGVRTRAKAEIWSDPNGFRNAGARLLLAARGVDRAAQGGDLGAIRAALPPLRAACAGCHDAYRGPEH